MSSAPHPETPATVDAVDTVDTVDTLGRPLRSLRLSVTDRCNLRCAYCMPEEEYTWLPKARILRFEEIARLVEAACELGVTRVRLTGGEPLLRRELEQLIALLASHEALTDLALTTNGLLLADQARALADAGLQRVTISIDTLRPERYRALTRRDDLPRLLAGIEAARGAGFASVKLNTVVMRGTNDDELADLVAFARERGVQARFIEYMDVGGATGWTRERVVPREEILARVAERLGAVELVPRTGEERSAPAERYRLADGTVFGVVASTTAPFCGACDRARLTADGRWFRCLYARDGLDVGRALRAGADRAELVALLAGSWSARGDRGAEVRLAELDRAPLAPVETLRSDPHLEMHTRGG